MYRAFFALHRLPFINTPDETFFFADERYRGVLHAIQYAVERGDALIKVTGEVGTGKTTLLRLLAERLHHKNFHLVFISSPRLSAEEMLAYIARELNIPVSDQDTKFHLYDKLSKYLLATYSQGERIVVLVDEAHAIPLDTLEEIRLLGNIETSKEKLLQIILFGQPELNQLLSRPEARQLASRITHAFEIEPLSLDRLHAYLNFRMKRAGYIGMPVFSREVADAIYQMTNGIPRLVNNVADKLLVSAYLRRSRQVGMEDVESLAKEGGIPHVRLGRRTRRTLLAVSIVAFVIGLGMTSLLLWQPDYVLGWIVESDRETASVAQAEKKADTLVKHDARPSSRPTEEDRRELSSLDRVAQEMKDAFPEMTDGRTSGIIERMPDKALQQVASRSIGGKYFIDVGKVFKCRAARKMKGDAQPWIMLKYVSGTTYLCEKIMGPFSSLRQAKQVLRAKFSGRGVILNRQSIVKRVENRYAELVYEY